MDLNAVIAILPAAVAGGALPFVRKIKGVRAGKREALRYLETLLVEARATTFPVVARHMTLPLPQGIRRR